MVMLTLLASLNIGAPVPPNEKLFDDWKTAVLSVEVPVDVEAVASPPEKLFDGNQAGLVVTDVPVTVNVGVKTGDVAVGDKELQTEATMGTAVGTEMASDVKGALGSVFGRRQLTDSPPEKLFDGDQAGLVVTDVPVTVNVGVKTGDVAVGDKGLEVEAAAGSAAGKEMASDFKDAVSSVFGRRQLADSPPEKLFDGNQAGLIVTDVPVAVNVGVKTGDVAVGDKELQTEAAMGTAVGTEMASDVKGALGSVFGRRQLVLDHEDVSLVKVAVAPAAVKAAVEGAEAVAKTNEASAGLEAKAAAAQDDLAHTIKSIFVGDDSEDDAEKVREQVQEQSIIALAQAVSRVEQDREADKRGQQAQRCSGPACSLGLSTSGPVFERARPTTLPPGLAVHEVHATCADSGPWLCAEHGCPSITVSCEQIAAGEACLKPFSTLWDTPPPGVGNDIVGTHCPRSCAAAAGVDCQTWKNLARKEQDAFRASGLGSEAVGWLGWGLGELESEGQEVVGRI